MSGALPSFRSGEPLRAAALGALAARVRELAARQASGQRVASGRRVVQPGRRYAFQLGEFNGVIYFRQGWFDAGNGELVAVGAREWNALGGLAECTVWLEIQRDAEGEYTGEVVISAYDEVTPETNLRRRLGYVRRWPGAAGGWLCVQVLGGLVMPLAPRREQGVADRGNMLVEGPGRFEGVDAAMYYRHGGFVVGEEYRVGSGEYEEVKGPSVVSFDYSCEFGEWQLPPEDGGNQLVIGMGFN